MSKSNDPMAQAISRLDRALTQVESRLNRLQASARDSGDADADRARLAEELDKARASEASMAEIADAASKALGEAIEELRAAANAAEAAVEQADG
jgi:chromosome segregation ATPase